MGAKTKEERFEVAMRFVETYNEWGNGNCYWYRLEERKRLPCGHTEDNDLDAGCGGYIGWDSLKEAIASEAGVQAGDEIVVRGEAKGMAQYLDLPEGAEIVDDFT
jgi:hypothetical protein